MQRGESRLRAGRETVPVEELDGRLILNDGQSRALASLLRGEIGIRACWEDERLDWEEYGVGIDWCLTVGTRSAADRQDRIILAWEYETAWISRCQSMREIRAQQRGAEERR